MQLSLIVSAVALTAGAGLIEAKSAAAAEADCASIAGTYITENSAKDESVASRSLLSFTEDGVAFFIDSGESGETGFAPFTEGRGAWRCVSAAGQAAKARATTLDFTIPTAVTAKAQIGRLDFELDYDAGQKAIRAIRGHATLYLVPIQADPLAPGVAKDGRVFEITGRRVEAP
jgi:hypothetical protein